MAEQTDSWFPRFEQREDGVFDKALNQRLSDKDVLRELNFWHSKCGLQWRQMQTEIEALRAENAQLTKDKANALNAAHEHVKAELGGLRKRIGQLEEILRRKYSKGGELFALGHAAHTAPQPISTKEKANALFAGHKEVEQTRMRRKPRRLNGSG